MAAKLIHREVEYVVGSGSEPAGSELHSSDLLCLDLRKWSSDDDATARQPRAQYGIAHGAGSDQLA
jgi:hypothetical protein